MYQQSMENILRQILNLDVFLFMFKIVLLNITSKYYSDIIRKLNALNISIGQWTMDMLCDKTSLADQDSSFQ